MNWPITRNMSLYERIIRFIAGVALLGLYGALPAPWRYFTLFGLLLVATAWSGWCPLYSRRRSPGGARQAGS
ncbi:MAG TPA: DUF2892 domain-containing protein [Gemmatimonadales bacterium]|nr:DUF2892 domain-containing protein [Gemmatimonadales bacterium]